MLRITSAKTPITVNQIVLGLYSLPGYGKTTLAFTADRPLLYDFDKGSYRAKNRKDVVQIEKWADVSEQTAEDLEPYKTLVVDTVGRLLDCLSVDIIANNPKHGYMGNLSLQGYGVLKGRFSGWLNAMRALGKDVVLISHMEEKQEGDVTKERFDIQGGSRSEVYKSADAIAKLYIDRNLRKLDFSPREGALGKNPAQFDILVVPDATKDPDYLATVIQGIKDSINQLSASQKAEMEALEQWKARIAKANTAEQFNALLPDAKLSTPVVKALVFEESKARGLKFDKEAGNFYAAPVEAAVPTLEVGLTEGEREWLSVIASTDGMEQNGQNDELDSLQKKGLVTFSGKRGPGGAWYHVELTNAGIEMLDSPTPEPEPKKALTEALNDSLAQCDAEEQRKATEAPDSQPAAKKGRPKGAPNKPKVDPMAAAPTDINPPKSEPETYQLMSRLDKLRASETAKGVEYQICEFVDSKSGGNRFYAYNYHHSLFQAFRAGIGKIVEFVAHDEGNPVRVTVDDVEQIDDTKYEGGKPLGKVVAGLFE